MQNPKLKSSAVLALCKLMAIDANFWYTTPLLSELLFGKIMELHGSILIRLHRQELRLNILPDRGFSLRRWQEVKEHSTKR